MVSTGAFEDVEGEQALIGALIQSPGAIGSVTTIIRQDAFSDPRARHLYTHILDMDATSVAVDKSTLVSTLRGNETLDKAGGQLFIQQCIDQCSNPQNVESYARNIGLNAYKRSILKAVGPASSQDEASVNALKVIEKQRGTASVDATPSITGAMMRSRIMESFQSPGIVDEMTMHYPLSRLDAATGGCRKGEFGVLMAHTNMGKTTFALQLLLHNALQGRRSLHVNTEMQTHKLESMLLKMLTGLPFLDIYNRKLEHQGQIMEAADKLANLPLNILPPRVWSPMEVEVLQRRERYDFVVYDHINRISEEPAEIAKAAVDLRTLALTGDCAVLCLQQVTPRADSMGQVPSKADARGSKTPINEADQVLILHRDMNFGTVQKTGVVRVDKSRVGPGIDVPIRFEDTYLRFVEA